MSDSRLTRAGDTGGATTKTFPPSDHEAITKAARGVPDRTASTLSFDAGTRTFTITPVSGAWSYYIAGRRYIKSAAESIVIADTSGPHWIYYDGPTLSEAVNPVHATLDNLIVNTARIGIVYWNATDGAGYVVADERHGPVMSGDTQKLWHDAIGATWHEGLALSGYVLDTDSDAGVDFEVSDGSIHDEDLEHDIVDGNPANQYEQQLNGGNAEIPILYRDDVDGSWTEDAATTLPYKTGGTGRLAYNNDDGDGTFSQIEVTDNKFVLATLIATNDWQYPIKMVQGQNEYVDQRTAVDEANAEQIAWGDMPSPEFVVLYRFVMRTKDTFGGTNQCMIVASTDLRRLSISGGLTSPAETHDILSATHSDSLSAAVLEGDVIVGNKTPEWIRLPVGAAGDFLGTDGTAVAWDSTVVTAGANLTDDAIVRGNGGALGVQTSLAILSDAGALSGLTQLDVDDLRFDGHTISGTAATDLIIIPDAGQRFLNYVTGPATLGISAWAIYNYAWAGAMTNTRTSLSFLQAYTVGGVGVGLTAPSGQITVGTEGNWAAAAATRDAYMAFSTVLDGFPIERVRINSVGAVGINTTDPGGLTASAILDIRKNALMGIGLYSFNATNVNHDARFFAGRARGVDGTPVIVNNGDRLFTFQSFGWDGATFKTGAVIVFAVDGAPGVGSMPTSISLRTGAAAAVERMLIQSDGDILIDTDSKMMWRDSDLYINSSADGILNIGSDGAVTVTAVEINLTGATACTGAVSVISDDGVDYYPGADIDCDIATIQVDGIPRYWWDESEDAFVMTHRLDLTAGGVQTMYATDDVADPPTDAELDAAFGDPTVVGPGFVGILDDNGGGVYCYICWTTGTAGEWFYIAGTKAV